MLPEKVSANAHNLHTKFEDSRYPEAKNILQLCEEGLAISYFGYQELRNLGITYERKQVICLSGKSTVKKYDRFPCQMSVSYIHVFINYF